MKSSELKATTIASASTRSPEQDRRCRRAPVAPVALAARPARAAPAARGRRGDEREGRGVDDHRQLEPAGRVQRGHRQRPEAEADVARGLDVPVRLLHAVLPASGGTSANSAGWEIAKTTPEQGGEREQRDRGRTRPRSRARARSAHRPRRPRRADGWPRRGRRAAPAKPAAATEGPNRQPRAARRRSRPSRSASLICSPSPTIATQSPERREADRGSDEAEVATAQQAGRPVVSCLGRRGHRAA